MSSDVKRNETEQACYPWTFCSCPGRKAVLFDQLFKKKHGSGTISDCKRSMRKRLKEWWVF